MSEPTDPILTQLRALAKKFDQMRDFTSTPENKIRNLEEVVDELLTIMLEGITEDDLT